MYIEKWTIYELSSPIDFWIGAKSLPEAIDDVQDIYSHLEPCLVQSHAISIMRQCEAVRQYICRDSELRHETHVIGLPASGEWMIVGYCFKLDNNGTTYVAIDSHWQPMFDWWFKQTNTEINRQWKQDVALEMNATAEGWM